MDGDDESDNGSDEDDNEGEGEMTLSDLYGKNLCLPQDFSSSNRPISFHPHPYCCLHYYHPHFLSHHPNILIFV